MTYYHVYVHYKDEEGKIDRILSCSFTKKSIERDIAIRFLTNKPFFLTGITILPSNVIQILIFKSEKRASHYTLPNGKNILDEPDIFYQANCFASKMEEIVPCTREFITRPPEDMEKSGGTPIIKTIEKARVFVVHGRDETQALRLQKYLTKALNLNAEIFEDFKERSGSKTIIEQLEYIKNNIGYAFVIVTPDDLGCLCEDIDNCRTKFMIGKESIKVDTVCEILDKLHSRARQNVVFEHGLFIGALGRDYVCCLLQKDTKEKPSDIDGILYVEFRSSVRETFSEIAEKLKNIGLIKA